MRKHIGTCATLALIAATLAAVPPQAVASHKTARGESAPTAPLVDQPNVLEHSPLAHVAASGKPKYIASAGHYYAEWYCTWYGGIVGAGFILAPEMDPVIAALSTSYWTGACELGSESPKLRHWFSFGVPRSSNPLVQCWMVFPKRGHSAAYAIQHRFRQCIYTV